MATGDGRPRETAGMSAGPPATTATAPGPYPTLPLGGGDPRAGVPVSPAPQRGRSSRKKRRTPVVSRPTASPNRPSAERVCRMTTSVVDRFERAWASVQDVEGWLTREQAHALFRAAQRVPEGSCIVEIGSHHGRSTIILAAGRASVDIVVAAVDPFDDERWGGGAAALDRFTENIERSSVDGGVRVQRGLSEDIAQDWEGPPVGLLYVDGAHDRTSVTADIDGWYPHLGRQAEVFFHDTFSAPGVTLAVLRRHALSRRYRFDASVSTLVSFTRVDLSLIQATWSSTRLAARVPYFLRNLLVKLAMRRGWRPVLRILRHENQSAFPY